MAEWFSIEVLDGTSSARAWREAFGDRLIAAGYGSGMTDWSWAEFTWGVILEDDPMLKSTASLRSSSIDTWLMSKSKSLSPGAYACSNATVVQTTSSSG